MNQKIASLSLIAILLFSSCGNSGGGQNPEGPGLDPSTPTNHVRGGRKNSPGKPKQEVPPKKLSVKELKEIYPLVENVKELSTALEAYFSILKDKENDKVLRYCAVHMLFTELYSTWSSVKEYTEQAGKKVLPKEFAFSVFKERINKIKQGYENHPYNNLLEKLEEWLEGIIKGDEKAGKLFGGPMGWFSYTGKQDWMSKDQVKEIGKYQRTKFNSVLKKFREGEKSTEHIQMQLKKIDGDPEKYRTEYNKIKIIPLDSIRPTKVTTTDLKVIKRDIKMRD